MKTPPSIARDLTLSRSLTRSLGRSLTVTGGFLKKQLWAWPLIAAVILGVVGIWLRSTVEGVMRTQLRDNLQAVLNADLKALRIYLGSLEAIASIAASDPEIQTLADEMIGSDVTDTPTLLRSPRLVEIRRALAPWVEENQYEGFAILDPRGRVVAAQADELIGRQVEGLSDALARALAGRATVSRPFTSEVMQKDLDGKERVGVPTMFALAPLPGRDGKPVGALGFQIRPETTFTSVLNVARFGESGETYAFDRDAQMLSQSRFDDDLKRIGLIADQPHVRSILNLQVRDPGVDMTLGERPAKRRGEQPPTRMAAAAVRGQDGVDLGGYRDYRGVPVLGAWAWLPEYDFGVTTEIDAAEGYRPLSILRMAFWGLFALLALAAAAIFVFTVLMARLQRKVQTAALAARQLGRYSLDEKIGEGGMGVVYRAHHAMLRRPTAVKLLSPEKTNDTSIARFEREVQMTASLCHPNTVTIFDYGRTPEGIFYYAMEYIAGVDLQALVERHGPQPEGRVVHILTQVCGSLAEAHGIGLVHRDIKPANILLTSQGGLPDFVKLLDFGLAKAVEAGRAAGVTAAGSLTGTPLYMAPEAIRDPERLDARSDLYSVGAVGYFLLTGRPVFGGSGIADILYKQVHEEPESPSSRLGRTVSPDLESLLLRCLSKRPDERPESAEALGEMLAACESSGSWRAAEARAWWLGDAKSAPVSSPVETPADPSAPTIASSGTQGPMAPSYGPETVAWSGE